MNPEFTLCLNPNGQDYWVLFPGWASDARIFDPLNLPHHLILAQTRDPFGLEDRLIAFLDQKGIHQVSILGWSMGGYVADQFVQKYPARIDQLILSGMRPHYTIEGIVAVQNLLKMSRESYLAAFYKTCFSKSQMVHWQWFKSRVLSDYLQQFNLEVLLDGLDYLAQHHLSPQYYPVNRTTVFYGEYDKIAPYESILPLKETYPQLQWRMVPKAGHFPQLL